MKKNLFLALLIAVTSFLGCSKGCGESSSSAPEQVRISTEDFSFETGLLGRIPNESLGFVVWQGAHPAYQRMLASPWAESASLSSMLPDSNPELTQLFDVLAAANLDPRDLKVMSQVFAEAVLFSYRGENQQLEHGMVFRPESQSAAKVIESLTEALKESKYESSATEVAGLSGLKVLLPRAKKNPPVGNITQRDRELFAVAHGELAVFALSEDPIKRIVQKETVAAPQIVESEAFTQVMKPLPDSSQRFVTGFYNTAALFAAEGAEAANPFPLEAIGIGNSMSEFPQMDVIALPRDKSQAEAFFASPTDFQGSVGEEFRGFLPSSPLLYLNVDGALLQQLKTAASEKFVGKQAGNAQGKIVEQLSFLSFLSRIAVSANVAPVGQSILPIPEFLLLLETTEPEKTKTQFKELVSMGLKNSPMTAALQWSAKTLEDGTQIESMMSPIGIGLTLASKDALVFVSTSEALARAILSGGAERNFQNSLAENIANLYANERNLSEFYLDFSELAGLLQNMGGVLALYAPQDKNAQQLLEAEKLAGLKKMGLLSARMRYEDGLLSLRTMNATPPEKKR